MKKIILWILIILVILLIIQIIPLILTSWGFGKVGV
jgi:hypothetical protein